MRPHRFRIDLLLLSLVGVAISTYGLASVSGQWLGVPPWWLKTIEEEWGGRGTHRWWEAREGREWISLAVIVAGLLIVVRATWRFRAMRWFKISLAVVGAAALVYGVASVTGRWLGQPLWWLREWRSDGGNGYYDEGIGLRAERYWISAIVIAGGALVVAHAARALRNLRDSH